MFYQNRFTERARQALTLAQEAAASFGHSYIGSEHLLLGLLREEEGLAHRVLTEYGLTDEMILSVLRRSVGAGLAGTAPSQGLTPRAKGVVELAVSEAARMGSPMIGTEHLLMGILREGGTISQRELQDTVPISSAAVSEVLAKLEFEGLITRTRSESDKRQLDVTLTENGQAEAKVCAEKHAKFEAEALSVLTEDEKGQLLGMLDRLMEHWQDIEEKDRAVEK